MLDLANDAVTMVSVNREDRAMLRSNSSARFDAGRWLGASACEAFPASGPSLGSKAENLRSWGAAPRAAKTGRAARPVGHMSTSSGLGK